MKLNDRPTLLLSTDLDGTLLGRGNLDLSEDLPRAIEELSSRYEVIWLINTGRRFASVHDCVLRSALSRPPDYLVDRETFIYQLDQGVYQPLDEWNQAAERRIEAMIRSAAPRLSEWGERLTREFPGVHVRYDSGVPLSVQTTSTEQSLAVRDRLVEWTADLPDVEIGRNGIWVSIWAVDCHKGKVLEEVARRHGVDRSHIMAVGDSENDLVMLDSARCGFPVAPANAEDSVKAFVRRHGGWVSDQPDIDGVLDGLRRFIQFLETD